MHIVPIGHWLAAKHCTHSPAAEQYESCGSLQSALVTHAAHACFWGSQIGFGAAQSALPLHVATQTRLMHVCPAAQSASSKQPMQDPLTGLQMGALGPQSALVRQSTQLPRSALQSGWLTQSGFILHSRQTPVATLQNRRLSGQLVSSVHGG